MLMEALTNETSVVIYPNLHSSRSCQVQTDESVLLLVLWGGVGLGSDKREEMWVLECVTSVSLWQQVE